MSISAVVLTVMLALIVVATAGGLLLAKVMEC